MLLVSHDLHLVMGATDQVVCLDRHVCCSGEPEMVSRHPEYVGLFGPRARRRLAIYTHDHDHGTTSPAKWWRCPRPIASDRPKSPEPVRTDVDAG